MRPARPLPESDEELTEGSACLAEIPEDLESIPEGGLPLCPLIGYVTCVDLPPFHDPTTRPVVGTIKHIELLPEVGPPGHTTTVEGTGFPPETQVELRWDRGIDCDRSIPASVGPDGTFTTQLLVMANDQLGTRTLTVGTADDPGAYPSAVADYLVVPGTAMPPNPDGDGFVIRR